MRRLPRCMNLSMDDFEKMVKEEWEGLPDYFKTKIDNLSVFVEDQPTPEDLRKTGVRPPGTLLGLYRGVSFKHRGPFYGNVAPDSVVLFRIPILSAARNAGHLKAIVRRVLIHEIGHYFGMNEAEIRQAEKDAYS